MSECPNCKGTLWVCENHSDKAWDVECSCGAGMPCVCNREAIHLGSTVLVDRSGVDSEALLETAGAQDKRIADLKAKLEGAERNSYPHMCRMDHDQIGHSDSENERCPLCRSMDACDHLNQQAAALAEALDELVERRSRVCAEIGGNPDGTDGRYARARSVLKTYREGR